MDIAKHFYGTLKILFIGSVALHGAAALNLFEDR
jgi:hypothetical protein